MNRSRPIAVAALAALLITPSCGAFKTSDVTPRTVDESLATTQVALISANQVFTSLVLAGKIPAPQAVQISEALDTASANLLTAKTLLRDREYDSASAYVKLINDILRSVQAQLSQYGTA